MKCLVICVVIATFWHAASGSQGADDDCRGVYCHPRVIGCKDGSEPIHRNEACCAKRSEDEGEVYDVTCRTANNVSFQFGDSYITETGERCSCEASGEFSCARVGCVPVKSCAEGYVIERDEHDCQFCTRAMASCVYSFTNTYEHGDVWELTNCSTCTCNDGGVSCQAPECEICGEGYYSILRNGRCCPDCLAIPKNCTYDGKTYKTNQYYTVGCTYCQCDNGAWVCEEFEGLSTCVCTTEDGTVHDNGTTWKADECHECTCVAGNTTCSKTCITPTTCRSGYELAPEKNNCCDVCDSVRNCTYNGRRRKHNTYWLDKCVFCGCQNGKVKCSKVRKCSSF